MKIYSRKERMGKTTKIIEKFREDPNGILIVISEREKERLIKEFIIKPYKILSIWEVPTKLKGRSYPINLYFDNLDIMLQSIFSANPVMATITEEKDNANHNN